MLEQYRKLLDILAILEGYFCIAAFACMVLVNIVEIAARNIFSISFSGIQEITILLGCWMVFIGAARIFSKGSLLNVDFLISKFKGLTRQYLDIALNFMIVFVLLVFLKYGFEMMVIQSKRTTEALHLPASWFVIALLVSSILMLLVIVLKVMDSLVSIRNMRGKK